MKTTKILSLSTITASLVFITGCTTVQTATNTNEVSNTNTNTVNTNATVANENTNTEQGSEVDTSDWLTYTNEEYGFSFEYKNSWSVDWNSMDQCWYIKDKNAAANTNTTTYLATLCTAGYFDQIKYSSLSDWQSHRGANGLKHDEETSAQTLNGQDVLFVHSPRSILDSYLILAKNNSDVLSLSSAQWSDSSLTHLLNSFRINQ
jgi:hypothetical protein